MQHTKHARALRRRMTDAERLLWHHLRGRRFCEHKFRRQVPLGPYIADFVCMRARLIIEVDGGQHASHIYKDTTRDTFLSSNGFRTLRFWNNEVLGNINGVLERLLDAIDPHRQRA